MFYGNDNSSGVSGDLQSATTIAGLMESHWGMGSGVSSLPALQSLGINGGTPEERRRGQGGIGFGAALPPKRDDALGGPLGQRIEANLVRLHEEAERILTDKRTRVLALAHALETHKTLTGEDVVAVLEGRQGPLVDGRPYRDPWFLAELERYHRAAVEAHKAHSTVSTPLPVPAGVISGEVFPGEEDRLRAASTAWVTVAQSPATPVATGPPGGDGD
jgi:hypothetical protein